MKILKRLGHLFLEVIAKGPGGMILRHLENREKLKEYEEEKRIQAILRQLEKTPSVCHGYSTPERGIIFSGQFKDPIGEEGKDV